MRKANEIIRLGELVNPLDFEQNFEDRQKHIESLLCKSLNMKSVVAFIGAGLSIPIGYPSWTQFAKDTFELLDITLSPKGDNCLAFKLFDQGRAGINDQKNNFKKVFRKAADNDIDRYIGILKSLLKDGYQNNQDDLKKVSEIYHNNKQDFDRFKNYLDEKKSKEIDFQTLFTECERFLCSKEKWEELRQAKFFRILVKSYFQFKRYFASAYKESELKDINKNPYLAILDLPIKKFATFNYDLELERAILSKNKNDAEIYDKDTTCEAIIKKSKERSFTQNKIYCDNLVKFSVSRFEEANNLVFHCHGRIDDVENCVISEEDYQKWYLQKNAKEFTPFRQTLNIVLESNPILFIGFSLSDPDFMRILRSITANRSIDKTRKPLFCLLYVGKYEIKEKTIESIEEFRHENREDLEELEKKIKEEEIKKLPGKTTSERNTTAELIARSKAEEKLIDQKAKWTSKQELQDECTMLYIKYGLHVIPVEDNMSKKLIELKLRSVDWWNRFLQKPKFRTFDFPTKDPYFHYKFKIEKEKLIDDFDEKLHEQLDRSLGFKTNTIESISDNSEYTIGFPRISAEKNQDDHDAKNQESKKPIFANNLAIVIGDGGTGKSWGVQNYINNKISLDQNNAFKFFFWSSYYTNDVLTGIDRLIDYFTKIKNKKSEKPKWLIEIEKNRDNPKYDKFKFLKLIIDNEPDAVIVFDGLEKLLKPNEDNTEGESVNPEVREFFKILTNGKVESKIILTTRLLPCDVFCNIKDRLKNETDYQKREELLEIINKIKEREILSAPKCWSTNLQSYLKVNEDYKNSFGDLQNFYSYFCSLFDGHVFAISIMKAVLNDLVDKPSEHTKLLISKIIRTPDELCVNRVIQEAIAHLDNELEKDAGQYESDPSKKTARDKIDVIKLSINTKKKYPLFERFIERMSLFMHPIRKDIAKICLEDIYQDTKKLEINTEKAVVYVLEKLYEKNLIQKVTIKLKNNNNNYKEEDRFVVHPLIRSYIFETLHESRFSSLPGLQLPGVTSSKEVVDPGNKTGKKVSLNLFGTLCNKVKAEAEKNRQSNLVVADICRAAFSIIRSRYCTNTVSRWGNYSEYLNTLLKLFDTTKMASNEFWNFNEPTEKGYKYCSTDVAPLYSDELAWLYNEIGITLFSMGNFLNASAIFGEGYEINRLIDRESEGRYSFQSDINKGAVYLHYGKLDTSMKYLNDAFELASKLNSTSLIGRVIGYGAIVKYLRGNLEDANNDFNNSYEYLKDNLRAKSIFLIMHGELLLKLNKAEEAFEKIEQSRHIAESVYYPDTVHYAKLARANYYADKNDHIRSQNEYQQVLQFAREKHLYRLESAALSGMSKLSEKLGDYSSAISRAIESLKISNEYSIRLHQTLSLIALGRALINGHQHRELGISCLKTARSMAQKQEYFLRANEAQEELLKLNIDN